jgi:hypothetical protein
MDCWSAGITVGMSTWLVEALGERCKTLTSIASVAAYRLNFASLSCLCVKPVQVAFVHFFGYMISEILLFTRFTKF